MKWDGAAGVAKETTSGSSLTYALNVCRNPKYGDAAVTERGGYKTYYAKVRIICATGPKGLE